MSIFKQFKTFKYIYPPRAESAINPKSLGLIGAGWIAQPKYNGSCSIVFINGKKSYELYNRHGELLTLQRPIDYPALNDSDEFMVLCGEYLNKNKLGEDGKPFNHKFVIWDILVHKGTYLIGKTFEERVNLLLNLFGGSRGTVTKDGLTFFNHLLITNHNNVFMAPSYLRDFRELYEEFIQTDLYEGLVLKKGSAKLDLGFKQRNNYDWQIKVRKSTKNYSF